MLTHPPGTCHPRGVTLKDDRPKSSNDPVAAFQYKLLELADLLRPWVAEIRQASKELLPLLPPEDMRELLAEADREPFALHLFHSVDCIIADVLVECIAELERYAKQTEDRETWYVWHDRDAGARLWRELDPEAPPRTAPG